MISEIYACLLVSGILLFPFAIGFAFLFCKRRIIIQPHKTFGFARHVRDR